jgi:Zn-dependent M28 family amino/carboxypeptidase
MRRLLILLAVVVVVSAFADSTNMPKLDPEKIRAHVKYLASDKLEGRGMNQKGGDLAAEYIAAQFKSSGLKPAGENGTYFQKVPMVGVKTLPATTFALAPDSGARVELKALDDYVTTNEQQTESVEINAPVVFVGYGISAPEYQWDDYKGYDLKGKVALLFVNEPISDDVKFFKGKALTYYGRWTYKFEETARRGAIATLIIHREDLASYPWTVVRNSWGGEKSFLKLDGSPKLAAASWIQWEVAKKLVGFGGLDLDKLFQQAQSRDFKPIALPVSLKGHVVSSIHPFDSRNVLGMVQGSDPAKKGEAILYTAHYDHFGIDKSKPAGANIFHGAADNATGCGIILEIGRAWAATKPAPARSILIAAVTAEEQGLLGSEYLGKHITQLPVRPVLDLNYDDLPPIGIPEDVEVVGAERTSFYPVVEEVAKQFNLTIRPDSRPEAGHYYRSDHFSLGRVGIPAFSVSEGMKYQGHDEAWGQAEAKEYVEKRYHQPADIYEESMDFRGDALMGQFGYALGQKAASLPEAPAWLPGDEFAHAQEKLVTERIGNQLFEGMPELRPLELGLMLYPPLARQTRISGTVVFKVYIAEDGSVSKVDVVSGHPVLAEFKSRIFLWRFEPGVQRNFELKCEFSLPGIDPIEKIYVKEPLHLVVAATPPMVNPQETSVGKRGGEGKGGL